MITSFSKLTNRGFTIFLMVVATHFISLLGSSVARFGLGVWAYQSTGQVSSFAVVLVAGFLPAIVLSPFIGIWIDRKGPRLLILLGDIIGLIISSIIFSSLLLGNISMVHVIAGAISLSIVSSMQTPALQTLAPNLVPKEMLSRANGVFSMASSTSDVLGPVIGGVIMGFGSIVYIIGAELVTYCIAIPILLILWTKLSVKVNNDNEDSHENNSILGDLKYGFNYLIEHKSLLTLVLLFTVLNFALGFNQVVGQPYILSFGTVEQFGLLSSIYGGGMVLGGILMSFIKLKKHIIWLVLISNFGIGVFITLTGLFNNMLLIAVFWGGLGLLLPVVNTGTLTLIQLHTEPKLLGRVFSIARTFAWISLPLAYILGGILADKLVASNVNIIPYLGSGERGVYGMLLLLAGGLIILTVAIFAQLKYIKELDRREENDVQHNV